MIVTVGWHRCSLVHLVIVLGSMFVDVGRALVGRFVDLVLDGIASSSESCGGTDIWVLCDPATVDEVSSQSLSVSRRRHGICCAW